MLEVHVCLGTSCHLRGAERVAEELVSLVRELGLHQEVQVKGAFCLQHCSEGVSVKVGDKVVDGLRVPEVRERLLLEILAQARGGRQDAR